MSHSPAAASAAQRSAPLWTPQATRGARIAAAAAPAAAVTCSSAGHASWRPSSARRRSVCEKENRPQRPSPAAADCRPEPRTASVAASSAPPRRRALGFHSPNLPRAADSAAASERSTLSLRKPAASSSASRSAPSPLRSLSCQLRSLQSQLAAEKERSAALAEALQRAEAALERELRLRPRVEDDELSRACWHPAADCDAYPAVNSDASSDREDDSGDDDDDDDEHQDEDQSGDSSAEQSCHSSRDHQQAPPCTGEQDEEQEEPEEGEADDECEDEEELDEDDKGQAEPDAEDGEMKREQEEEEEQQQQQQQVDSLSRAVAAASLSVSSRAASSSCSSVCSSPGFKDSFPYERNLYLLCRHYHLHHRLYSCQDAVTFRATHIASQAAVVIKLSSGFRASASHPKEVRVLTAAQGHRNVLRLRGWYGFPATACYAFVSDWLENDGIESVWEQEEARRAYLRCLLLGLQHLHRRGILHRDVKPSNCLWSARSRHATIIDFDVATFYDCQRRHSSRVGTSGYFAPEMQQGRRYGQEVDAYSAGVLLGQLLFRMHEDEVADERRTDCKGPQMVQRVLDWAEQHGGRIGAEQHLLLRLLTAEPHYRISVSDALQHPYFTAVRP